MRCCLSNLLAFAIETNVVQGKGSHGGGGGGHSCRPTTRCLNLDDGKLSLPGHDANQTVNDMMLR